MAVAGKVLWKHGICFQLPYLSCKYAESIPFVRTIPDSCRAYCQKEDFAKASADISTLRQARYQTYGSATLTSENWLDEIDKERLRELFMEGFRLQDLKRWGKGFERKPQEQSVRDGSSLKIEAGNPLFVWPIPQHELDLPGSAIEPNESNK